MEGNKRNAWKIHIPLAQKIINSEVHSRLGVSPNDLVFGGKLNITSWSSLQDKLVDLAQQRQHEKDEQHMNKRRSSNVITEFKYNSFVLIQYPKSAMATRAPTKQHIPWKGPMRAISNIGA